MLGNNTKIRIFETLWSNDHLGLSFFSSAIRLTRHYTRWQIRYFKLVTFDNFYDTLFFKKQ